LNENQALQAQVQPALALWLPNWNQLPEGAGKRADRVFVTENGNAMQARQIKVAREAEQSAQAAAGGARLPPNWKTHRNALLTALYPHYDNDDRALAMLTFAQLNDANEALPAPVRDAIALWRADWDQFPAGAGKQADRVFLVESGNAMKKTNLPRTRQTQGSARAAVGHVQLPTDWVAHRKALLTALYPYYNDDSALAMLTFAQLSANRELPAPVQAAIALWRTDWNQIPAGTGKQADRVFLVKSGNTMTKTDIMRARGAQPRAQAAAGGAPLPIDQSTQAVGRALLSAEWMATVLRQE
jgi:hypothetical protein